MKPLLGAFGLVIGFAIAFHAAVSLLENADPVASLTPRVLKLVAGLTLLVGGGWWLGSRGEETYLFPPRHRRRAAVGCAGLMILVGLWGVLGVAYHLWTEDRSPGGYSGEIISGLFCTALVIVGGWWLRANQQRGAE